MLEITALRELLAESAGTEQNQRWRIPALGMVCFKVLVFSEKDFDF